MLGYNLEQRRLLFYPHKFIPYDQKPKVISLPMFDLASIYWDCQFELVEKFRTKLLLASTKQDFIKEYKEWVDNIEISKIIPCEKQGIENVFFNLEKIRPIDTYLYNLYKLQIKKKTSKKLTREELNDCNPLIKYHIANYHRLHNYWRESPKNYFLPNYLIKINESI